MKTTPVAIAFTVLVALALGACKKNKLPNPDKVTIDSKSQFSALVDGAVLSYGESNSTEVYSGDFSLVANPDTSTFIYVVILADPGVTKSYLQISLGTLRNTTGYPSTTVFNDFFVTGSYPFTNGGADGVEIKYWDEAGTEYSTSNGAQSGAQFTLDDVRPENLLGTDYMKFKALFNCTLYDSGGNPITLSDGLYVGYFANL